MRLIKRYANRKLYDTEAKCYVTLDDLAALICNGQDIQVLDNNSAEDLTAVIMTQIISEKEKKQGGFVPRAVLNNLIKSGGDSFSALRRGLTTPMELLEQIDLEIERRVRTLASRGELAEEEAWRLIEKLLGECDHNESDVRVEEDTLQQVFVKRGIPSREDFQRLNRQVESLEAKIDEIM